ncbi:MAG: hypothetical protein V1818_00380 [Candidatus Aenigmatarchaeota archaeon]
MVFLAQVLPFSVGNIVPIVISILFGAVTAWISAQIVSRHASLQGALLFSVVSYVVIMISVFIPTIAIPFISTMFAIEAVIKSLLAMKFFNTDFRSGLAITGVQMLLGMILIIPYF